MVRAVVPAVNGLRPVYIFDRLIGSSRPRSVPAGTGSPLGVVQTGSSMPGHPLADQLVSNAGTSPANLRHASHGHPLAFGQPVPPRFAPDAAAQDLTQLIVVGASAHGVAQVDFVRTE